MFNSVRNKEIDEFSKNLAQQLAKQYATGQGEKGKTKKATKKLATAFAKIYEQAAAFQQEHKLGIYGKARLGNTFKWELKEMGYEEDFVEKATKGLVLSINQKKGTSD